MIIQLRSDVFFVHILFGIEKSLLVYCGIEENAFIVIGMNHICFRNGRFLMLFRMAILQRRK